MTSRLIQNTGKVEALRNKLIEKRRQLLDIFAEKDNLERVVKPKLIYEYEILFGALENELKLKHQIAQIYEEELLLLITKVKRGEKIPKSTVKLTENRIKERVNSTHDNTVQSVTPDDKNKPLVLSPQSKKTLVIMFRAIAKKIHPDVKTVESPFACHWDAVLEAYKSNDIGKITLFHNLICAANENIEEDYNEIENLEKNILLTQRRIDYEKRKLNRIKQTEPFSLEAMLKDEKMCERRKKLIELKISETEKSIAMSKQLLNSLLDGSISETIEQEDQEFQEEFFSNTYSRR